MRVTTAICRGLRFLETQQLPTGEFVTHACQRPDMTDRTAYEPTVFTTAIVARALAGIQDASVARMTRRAVAFFLKEMPQPGLWGWATRRRRGDFPLDVDDTACISALLRRNRVPFPDNRTALLANRTEQGLFLTWFRDPAINPFSGRLPVDEQRNVDAAVNAHVLAYLGPGDQMHSVVQFLYDTLESPDVADFRYYGHVLAVAYASAHALAAGVGDIRRLRPAVCHVLRTPSVDGSHGNALLDALALSVAHAFEATDVLPQSLVESLLDQQSAAGAWPRAKMFQRMPGPYYGSVELSTALCVEALHHVQIARASGEYATS